MKCKFCQSSMQSLNPSASNEFNNYICFNCSAHYYGDKGKEKWYDKKTWEDWVNVVDGIDGRIKIGGRNPNFIS